MKKLGSASGFSMIELLIVTSVAVILMMAAAPSFTQVLDSKQLGSATNHLALLFKQARLEAIRRNQELYIHNLEMTVPTKNNWCVLVTASATAPASCTFTQVILSLHGESLPRLSVKGSKARISLDPARAITGSGMSYTLTSPDMGEGVAVKVNISGRSRVKICSEGTVVGYESC